MIWFLSAPASERGQVKGVGEDGEGAEEDGDCGLSRPDKMVVCAVDLSGIVDGLVRQVCH